MTNKGWQCPACGKVYAPHVDECKHCNKEGMNWLEIKRKYFPNVPDMPDPPFTTPTGPTPYPWWHPLNPYRITCNDSVTTNSKGIQ